MTSAKQRIVIIAHYGFHRTWDFKLWWQKKDARKFYRVIKKYNVIAYIHGHNHSTSHYKYKNINVFDVGSPFYTYYNLDRRGHYTIFRITKYFLEVQDISWDPNHPKDISKLKSRFKLRRRIFKK